MKVIQLVEQSRINSALDLKNAFNEDQWRNIIIHFNQRQFTQSDQGMLDTAEGRIRSLQRLMDMLGPGMNTTYSPGDWSLRAQPFNMSPPQRYPTWQDIYDHLSPWKDEQHNFSTDMPELSYVDPDGTPERVGDIANWAQGEWPENFTSASDVQGYVQAFMDSLPRHREEAWMEIVNRGSRNNNPIIREWNTMILDLYAQLPKSKRDIDFQLLGWLNYAGRMVAARQARDNVD